MWRVALDRHDGAVNVAFMDGSVSKVDIKELWSLKWSRVWDTDEGPNGGWPEWMDKFKDYDYPGLRDD
nr:H-X9-DG-CTERM domain-containing protein [Anaerohalosphaera lusitana]